MKNQREIVSVVVSDKIRLQYQTEFENWQERIISELEQFEGFISVSSKKLESPHNEYFTVFQFDSNQNLQKWLDSSVLKKYLFEAKQYTLLEPKISFHEGLELFFNKKEASLIQPPFYKKVLLGIMAVYPLILIVGKLFHRFIPGFSQLPFEAGLFFEVIVVSTLMTYPVMPTLSKWLRFWLFK